MTDERAVEGFVVGREAMRLDRDVSLWLSLLADRVFLGDRATALNFALRLVMAAEERPGDSWAVVSSRRYSELGLAAPVPPGGD